MDLFIYELAPNSKFTVASTRDSFRIATCQRTVVVSKTEISASGALRSFEGSDAYEYLLRVACGLESQIKGETDIFGQVKSAFKEFLETAPDSDPRFHSLFAKLLEDTKEIRANYLHGIGGNTYGALARRLLNPNSDDQVVVLGAGQISKSVAPYFADSKLSIFNRSSERLIALNTELAKKGYSNIEYFSDETSLKNALSTATLILICTPPGSDLDQQVIHAMNTNSKAEAFHFGAQHSDLALFHKAAHLTGRVFSLTELFKMEKTQGTLRDRQVSQALTACRHRALLRSMSRSIHIAHGWEDLPAFY